MNTCLRPFQVFLQTCWFNTRSIACYLPHNFNFRTHFVMFVFLKLHRIGFCWTDPMSWLINQAHNGFFFWQVFIFLDCLRIIVGYSASLELRSYLLSMFWTLNFFDLLKTFLESLCIDHYLQWILKIFVLFPIEFLWFFQFFQLVAWCLSLFRYLIHNVTSFLLCLILLIINNMVSLLVFTLLHHHFLLIYWDVFFFLSFFGIFSSSYLNLLSPVFYIFFLIMWLLSLYSNVLNLSLLNSFETLIFFSQPSHYIFFTSSFIFPSFSLWFFSHLLWNNKPWFFTFYFCRYHPFIVELSHFLWDDPIYW